MERLDLAKYRETSFPLGSISDMLIVWSAQPVNISHQGFFGEARLSGNGPSCSICLLTSFIVLVVLLLTGGRVAKGQPVPTLAGLTRNGSAQLTGSVLRLTDGGLFEQGSAFTSQYVSTFQTQFNFQLTSAEADGFAFVIQNQGVNALGGEGGNLGYTGINRSVAVAFDIYNNNGEGGNSTYLLSSGSSPSGVTDLTASSIDLHSGHLFHVTIVYSGTLLQVTLKDLITGMQAQQVYQIDLEAYLGNTTAFVGFTGGTGGLAATQDISAWSFGQVSQSTPTGSNIIDYASGFPSGTKGLTLNGVSLVKDQLQLTDGNLYEAGSAFYSSPVDIRAFTTDFTFQVLDGQADGLTFTIQNDPAGPAALGIGGGQLGYGGIHSSLAVKFDFFNNSGEGMSSTGFYVNGATPTVPAINLANCPLYVNNGDVFHVHLVYDGTTLTLLLTDPMIDIHCTATEAVNIPLLVGANFAYVGFTAGTGAYTATQRILNWNFGFSPSASVYPDLTIFNFLDQFSSVPNFYSGSNNYINIMAQNTGAAPTSGTITISGTLPPGLTAISMSGAGWVCNVATISCTTNTVVSPGGFLPNVSVQVSADVSYAGTVQSLATVSGGGEVNTENDSFSFIEQIVEPLAVSLSFTPSAISLNGDTVLVLNFTNPNTVAITGNFALSYPSGFAGGGGPLVPIQPYSQCNARQGEEASATELIAEGVTIPINGRCTFEVSLKGKALGTFAASFRDYGFAGVPPSLPTATVTVTPVPTKAGSVDSPIGTVSPPKLQLGRTMDQ